MATYFLDTNALVKLYAFDSTSYWTIGIVASRRPRHRIVVSEIVQVEVPSALYKLERIDATIVASQTDLAGLAPHPPRRLPRLVLARHAYRVVDE